MSGFRIFTCKGFNGHWPVPTAAVAVARDASEASLLLQSALREHGLQVIITPSMMEELFFDQAQVRILSDGDY